MTGGAAAPPPAGRAGTASGTTDEPADLIALADLADRERGRPADPGPRPADRPPAVGAAAHRGTGGPGAASGSWPPCRGPVARTSWTWSARWRRWPATPTRRSRTILVRERVRQRRSVVLVVDVSGSMKGERVRTAAATVGALAGELARDSLAVVAFWSDAAVLVRMGEQVPPLAVLDLLLRVPTQGLTNVTFALETAARQLAGVPPRDARVLLLSDCVHNAGPDPRLDGGPAAAAGRAAGHLRGGRRRAGPGAGPGRPGPAAAGP